MDVMAGFVALTAFAFGTALLGMACPSIKRVLWTAFGVRVAVALTLYFAIWQTPFGGGNDAARFEATARGWALLPWPELIERFDASGSYVYSWVGAVTYKVFAPSELLLISLNVFLGTVVVFLSYLVLRRTTGEWRARKLVWLAALFPPAVLWSALALREMIAIAPLMVGLLLVVRSEQESRTVDMFGALVAFAVAGLFHGGLAFAILGLGVVMLWQVVRELLQGGSGFRIDLNVLLKGATGLALVLGLSLSAVQGSVRLSSVGNLDVYFESGLGEVIEDQTAVDPRGGSAYPSAAINVVPVRIAYFLLSPFPWDVRAVRHLFGLIASGVFMYIMMSMWKSRSIIWRRHDLQALSIILGTLIFVFALGTFNTGTAIRHRTKFFFALLALCALPVFETRKKLRSRRRGPHVHPAHQGLRKREPLVAPSRAAPSRGKFDAPGRAMRR